MYFNPCFKTKSLREKSLIKRKQNNYHQNPPYFFVFTNDNRFFQQVSFVTLLLFSLREYVPELEEACWKGYCGAAWKFIEVYICCITFGGI